MKFNIMKLSKTRFLFIPLFFAILGGLAPTMGWGVTARAIFLGAGSDSPTSAVIIAGEKKIEIDLPRRNLSSEVKLPNDVLKAAVLSQAPASGEAIDPAAPVVTLPQNSGRVLLLFLPDPKNKVFPVSVRVIDASTAKFPAGHSVLFNLTNHTVAGKFGGKPISVVGGRSKLIDPPRTKGNGYPVLISYKAPQEEKWKVLCSSTWMQSPKSRQLIFVVHPPGRRSPRIWSVFDHPQVARNTE